MKKKISLFFLVFTLFGVTLFALTTLKSPVESQQKVALVVTKEQRDELWKTIQKELAKPEFSHLSSRSKFIVKGIKHNLSVEKLFTGVYDGTELINLINAGITPANFKTALKDTLKIDDFWAGIKVDLKGSQLQSFLTIHKKSFVIDGESYSLTKLITAAKNSREFAKDGSLLSSTSGPTQELQALVDAGIDASKFKSTLNQNIQKLNTLWTGIREKLRQLPSLWSSSSFDKRTTDKGARIISLIFFASNPQEFAKSGSQLSSLVARKELWKLVNAGIDVAKFHTFLDEVIKVLLDEYWLIAKSELIKPEFSHLQQTVAPGPATFCSLSSLLAATKNPQEFTKVGSQLSSLAAREELLALSANFGYVEHLKVKVSLKRTNLFLDTFWTDIKAELTKTEFSHLSDNFNYDLSSLITAAKDPKETKGSALKTPGALNALQFLFRKRIHSLSTLREAIVKNQELLNALWSGIKTDLKSPQFSPFSVLNRQFFMINGNFHLLTELITVTKNSQEFAKDGSQLSSLAARKELQALVDAGITPAKFKTAVNENNQKLNVLWAGIKDSLQRVKYANLQGTDLQFVNKITTNIDALFIAAQDKQDFAKTGSNLTGDALVKLQELVIKKVTAPEVNAALAVAKVQKEKEEKPAAKKAKETKKAKAKSKTALTIGLATGGGVLLLAGGTGGFLYWFYKIKK